ncbi:MAG: PEP-CTERM sorting domain-containing protein [Fimbriimonadaceae bacterium]|nr:PEP-CTERM sorting domain-containing protein [Fimbriimonadaceae bacterium]
MKLRTTFSTAILALAVASQATILTFDIDGISNFQNMNQAYGDNVTATTMGGFHYGVGAEGFTPNVSAQYGTGDPALWTTGYGDMTNVLFEDQDNAGILTITLSAGAGIDVVLYSFDLAAYTSAFSSDPTVQSITVTDASNNALFSQTNGTVSKTTRTAFDFTSSPLVASSLKITVDARNLGSLNDDIAADNIVFGEQAVPEPATLVALGLGALLLRRRRA